MLAVLPIPRNLVECFYIVLAHDAAQGSEVAAYVGLSPGSLSDESIAAIDSHRLPWLLIVSRNARYLKEVAQALRDHSRTAEFLEVNGTAHATDLLSAHPDLAERIAVWFRYRLMEEGGTTASAK